MYKAKSEEETIECQLNYNTPSQKFNPSDTDSENSPFTNLLCTQEGIEVDVVWDWNSPQSKQNPKRKKQKKLVLAPSPKLTIKRHLSNNQTESFEKLKEELKALKEQIAIPDNEDSLVLSPLEEAQFKDDVNFNNTSAIATLIQENTPNCDEDLEDLFNDSDNEQLFLLSQQLECEIEKPVNNSCNVNEHKTTNIPQSKTSTIECAKYNAKINDSFDCAFEKFHYEHPFIEMPNTFKSEDKIMVTNTAKISNTNTKLSRTHSDEQYTFQTSTGKVEFYRTQSFELATVNQTSNFLPQIDMAEIERKRRNAIEKLRSKNKIIGINSSYTSVKCSPEEIEQKRLQALATREAKKQQEIIERKRQEALKRLEMNRKRNATMVKSSLSKRL